MINTNEGMSKAFTLKGSLFALTILQLLTSTLDAIEAQLDIATKKSPTFFNNNPIILDLHKLQPEDKVNFVDLSQILKKFKMNAVGVIGGSEEQNLQANLCNLSIVNKSVAAMKKKDLEEQPEANTLLINKHIRSGQQICNENGDLIITASVSPGAEVLAKGNIHIYGALLGRAFAGIKGDKTARIFCRELKAELIAIAGNYKTSDEIKVQNLPVQIFLEQDQLQIREL